MKINNATMTSAPTMILLLFAALSTLTSLCNGDSLAVCRVTEGCEGNLRRIAIVLENSLQTNLNNTETHIDAALNDTNTDDLATTLCDVKRLSIIAENNVEVELNYAQRCELTNAIEVLAPLLAEYKNFSAIFDTLDHIVITRERIQTELRVMKAQVEDLKRSVPNVFKAIRNTEISAITSASCEAGSYCVSKKLLKKSLSGCVSIANEQLEIIKNNPGYRLEVDVIRELTNQLRLSENRLESMKGYDDSPNAFDYMHSQTVIRDIRRGDGWWRTQIWKHWDTKIFREKLEILKENINVLLGKLNAKQESENC